MSKQFPHLQGSNEDVYGYGREVFTQITGNFDYTQWTEGAKITLLSVPWGVYDPAIMTDRPAFDSITERDAYFNNHINRAANTTESHVLESRVRYQMKDYVNLPFTFDYASLYNYLIVEYPDAPVSGGSKGIRKFFYHITDIDYSAPSTTKVILVPDWWVTVAPLLDINHMILARGHAPIAETSVENYLSNPLNNSELLLAPDVDFGTNTIVANQDNDVINDDNMWAVVCTKGIDLEATGTNHYEALKFGSGFTDGIPTAYELAVPAPSLKTFLDNWHSQAPQTIQALETIYLVSEKLLYVGRAVTVFNVACRYVQHNTYFSDFKITKDKFNYPEKVAHLAKLYTAPYAHIEITDSEGSITTINIEDLTSNTLSVEVVLNGAFPWLNISTHVLGVGGNKQTLNFRTTQNNEFVAGGKWYETLNSWGVPCFSIYQTNEEANDYKTHWSRVQRGNDADTAYTNATASNVTAYNNATASNATAQTNSNNSAATAVNNNAITVAATTTTTARTVSGNNSATRAQVSKLSSDWGADFATSSAALEAEQNAVALAASNNLAQGVTGMVAGTATLIGSAATGNVLGVVSSASSLVSSGLSLQGAQASYTMSQSNNASLYGAATAASETKLSSAVTYNNLTTGYNNSVMTDNTATNNNAATSTTANSASMIRTNASNSRNTGDANASRTKSTGDANANRTKDNAYTAITNSIKEAAVQTPATVGIAKNAEFVTTRPMVLSCNIVTESRSAIMQAATQFLRYGYALNQAFEFESWNCMKNFTYWQVSDIWATGVDTVPEEGQDAVRRMLYTGVTCWRDPDMIGKVSIYDN